MNKKPIIVNEKDIVKIKITDGQAGIIYDKDPNDDTRYIATYYYTKHALGDEYKYCSICGNMWKADHADCIRQCDESEREILFYNQVADVIYDSLEDNLNVIILDKYNNEHVFRL